MLYDINSRNSFYNTGVNKEGLKFFIEAYNSETTIMYIFNKEGICITQYTVYKYIQLENIKQQIELLEIETYLNGKYDDLPCYLEIHPGAGGTEAHDWANMLLRMYEMFCDKNNFSIDL